jgi:hypothetical protein
MSEDGSNERIADPKLVWPDLDTATQERVIQLFIGLAVRMVSQEREDCQGPDFISLKDATSSS